MGIPSGYPILELKKLEVFRVVHTAGKTPSQYSNQVQFKSVPALCSLPPRGKLKEEEAMGGDHCAKSG